MNFLIYLKNVVIVIVIVHVIVHVIVIVKKNHKKCVCLTDKYKEFCEEDSIILKETTNSYFNVEYIKFFDLLQKAIDQITSKKLNLYNEIEIDMLIIMFINLYHNSNIDCNKNVENKICNLYQYYYY